MQLQSFEKELRKAWLNNESLMTILTEYNICMKSLKRKLEDEDMNEMAVL